MSLVRTCAMALSLSVSALAVSAACADEQPRPLPPPALDTPQSADGSQVVVLSGGCFWGMQGVFEHVKGVRQVVAGYSGGARNTANYQDVSEGNTGHAESVQITFDPRQISYGELLRVFFSVAEDPTELNRQSPDEGTNYRSNIFYADPAQERIARSYIAQLGHAHAFSKPIVTRVDKLTGFYPAENYHQDYLIHNPDSAYIVINDMPKIAALKRIYPAMYRDAPVMVSMRPPS
ncbi:MAG TPA: peptide-methionine (S)-S-oxide reductase MsrA [Rhizomicrobium sp.]